MLKLKCYKINEASLIFLPPPKTTYHLWKWRAIKQVEPVKVSKTRNTYQLRWSERIHRSYTRRRLLKTVQVHLSFSTGQVPRIIYQRYCWWYNAVILPHLKDGGDVCLINPLPKSSRKWTTTCSILLNGWMPRLEVGYAQGFSNTEIFLRLQPDIVKPMV